MPTIAYKVKNAFETAEPASSMAPFIVMLLSLPGHVQNPVFFHVV